MQLIQALLLQSELPNLALAQDSQSTPPTNPNKDVHPGPASLSVLCRDLPVWPLEEGRVLPPGSVCNKCLYPISLWSGTLSSM